MLLPGGEDGGRTGYVGKNDEGNDGQGDVQLLHLLSHLVQVADDGA